MTTAILLKNTASCAKTLSGPSEISKAATGPSQSRPQTPTTHALRRRAALRPRRAPADAARSASPCPSRGAPWRGATRAERKPIAAAAATIAGKGTSKAKIAMKAAAAMATIPGPRSARLPMRSTASITTASTAVLMP